MPDLYLIEFKGNRREYYYNTYHHSLRTSEYVIVQAERGEDAGILKSRFDRDLELGENDRPRSILRPASDEDKNKIEQNHRDEEAAWEKAESLIKKHQLEMRLVDIEYQFDRNKLTFFFTAVLIGIASTTRSRVEANRQFLFERAVLSAVGTRPESTASPARVHAVFSRTVRHPTPSSGRAYLCVEGERLVAYALPIEGQGCSVVREYCGHGIGKGFHEDPQVLHYGRPGTGEVLVPGMVFTIEPMINLGRRDTKLLPDGWTVVTRDRSLSAQWEHTIAVTEDGHTVLTQLPGDPL